MRFVFLSCFFVLMRLVLQKKATDSVLGALGTTSVLISGWPKVPKVSLPASISVLGFFYKLFLFPLTCYFGMVNRYWSVSSDFHFLDDSLTPQHPRMFLACVLCKVRRCGVVWNFDKIFIRFWGGVIRSAFRVVWWTECLLLTTLFINKIGFLPPSIAIRTVILVVSAVIEYLHFGSIFRVVSLFCFSSKYLYIIFHTHSQLSLRFCVFAKNVSCKTALDRTPLLLAKW